MAGEVTLAVASALAFFSFNWATRYFVLEPSASKRLGLHRPVQRQKFAQSAMEIVFYGGFSVLGLAIVPRQEWSWPSSQWWAPFLQAQPEVLNEDVRLYYMLYLARYAQAVVSVLLEHKRKDFAEMMVHHWATIMIILLSYNCGWTRIGAVIMVIFDPADVPLHMAKVCKYISGACQMSRAKRWQKAADGLFVVFLLVFVITRLVCYSYVCWSAHVESKSFFVHGWAEHTAVALLYVLLALQVYWFGLIVKVVMKLVMNGGVEDVRSDDEAEVPSNGKEHEAQEGNASGEKNAAAADENVKASLRARPQRGRAQSPRTQPR